MKVRICPTCGGAVVVREVWFLPLVPPRFRTAGGCCRDAAGRQPDAAFPGGYLSLVP
jgi:hypothetical protein